ncbi:MAG: CPBP family intramembrane glutamic endopeptidase [Acidobacteriota bacterium]
MNNLKRIRLIELLLVSFVAFGQSIFYSAVLFFAGEDNYTEERINVRFILGVISELSAIAILVYVLFRQGRKLKDLGLTFSWKDLPFSVLLFLGAFVVSILFQFAISVTYHLVTGKTLNTAAQNLEVFKTSSSFFYFLYVLVNPFYEEIIARAFVMTEVKELFGKTYLAIASSVILQTSYHLYQGVSSALILFSLFLAFSLYYSKTRNITPIILAHFYFDLMAFLFYSTNSSQ